MSLKHTLSCSQMGQAKPVYIPPKDLNKYSPHQSSLQQLPVDPKGLRDGYGSSMSVTGLSQYCFLDVSNHEGVSDCLIYDCTNDPLYLICVTYLVWLVVATMQVGQP